MPTPHLNDKHVVFGEVQDGFDKARHMRTCACRGMRTRGERRGCALTDLMRTRLVGGGGCCAQVVARMESYGSRDGTPNGKVKD